MDQADVHGWVVLDKPVGLSSARAVGLVKRLTGARKAGHAGTLDPLASGSLPIALGEATKTISFIMDGQKTYQFTVTWGRQTATDDTEGEVIASSEIRPASQDIHAVLPDFTGKIMQHPPAFSAIKVKGRRAYALARAGEPVDLKAREVLIRSLELIECPNADQAIFQTRCGKGTYIRSLARDMAEKLGTKGHISALRRLSVGSFNEESMISLDKLEELSHIAARQEALSQVLLPLETVLDDIPVLAVSGEEAVHLKHGRAVDWRNKETPCRNGSVFVMWDTRPIALAELKQGLIHPKRVFNMGEMPE